MNNEDQQHYLQTTPHFGGDEHEYQALDTGHQQQTYLESSPEFYPASNLIETKYNPHNYVKNFGRGKFNN